jgi:uncharacterized protein YllA (UPF0747 family)
MLLLRNSFLLIDEKTAGKIGRMDFSPADFFKEEHLLMKQFTQQHSNNVTSLNGEFSQAGSLYNEISSSAAKIDTTLTEHIAALKKKALKGLEELEKKMLRAEKKKFVTEQEQIQKIRSALFPNNGLQERVENFSGFYAVQNGSLFKNLLLYSKSFYQQFAVITSNE